MSRPSFKPAYFLGLLLAILAKPNQAQAGYIGTIVSPTIGGNENVPISSSVGVNFFGFATFSLPNPDGVFAQVTNTGTNVTPSVSTVSLGATMSVDGSRIPNVSRTNPFTLQVTGSADAIFPYFVPLSPDGKVRTFLVPSENFRLQGTIAAGDVVDYTIEGGSNLASPPLPNFHGIISDAGPFSVSYSYTSLPVEVTKNQGQTISAESGMGFTISIEHFSPTSSVTSVELVDPVTVFTPVDSVPEPSSCVLALAALLAFIGRWRIA